MYRDVNVLPTFINETKVLEETVLRVHQSHVTCLQYREYKTSICHKKSIPLKQIIRPML